MSRVILKEHKAVLPRAEGVETSGELAWPDAFHWWIDAVGGFLTLRNEKVRIGQAGCPENDVAILGDLSAHHVDLRRGKSGFLLLAHGETTVNGKQGREFLLHGGDRIRMRSVEMVFHQSAPWSTTARLELVSPHRLPLALDGVLLLGETCIIGPRKDAHVVTDWDFSLCVSWHREGYWVRGKGSFVIDGREYDEFGPLAPNSEVQGPWGAFRWEPVGSEQ